MFKKKKKCHHLHFIPWTQLVFSFSCSVFITLYCHILHSCIKASFKQTNNNKEKNNPKTIKVKPSPKVKLAVGGNSVMSKMSLRRKCLLKKCNAKISSQVTRFKRLKSEENFEMIKVFSNIYFPLMIMKLNYIVDLYQGSKVRRLKVNWIAGNFCP